MLVPISIVLGCRVKFRNKYKQLNLKRKTKKPRKTKAGGELEVQPKAAYNLGEPRDHLKGTNIPIVTPWAGHHSTTLALSAAFRPFDTVPSSRGQRDLSQRGKYTVVILFLLFDAVYTRCLLLQSLGSHYGVVTVVYLLRRRTRTLR